MSGFQNAVKPPVRRRLSGIKLFLIHSPKRSDIEMSLLFGLQGRLKDLFINQKIELNISLESLQMAFSLFNLNMSPILN
jgi:hypothetical protein